MDSTDFNPDYDLDITGLEWWEVLKRLHAATQALGPFAGIAPKELTDEQAIDAIGAYIASGQDRFDWVHGRPMKIGFHTKEGRSWVSRIDLYNRDAPTPASFTIASLRAEHERKRKARDEGGPHGDI